MSREAVRGYWSACAVGGLLVVAGWAIPGVRLYLSGYIGAGDSPEDDIEGARALGMRALLIDRENRFPDEPERLPDLYALPAALGLERPTGDTIRGR